MLKNRKIALQAEKPFSKFQKIAFRFKHLTLLFSSSHNITFNNTKYRKKDPDKRKCI